MKNTTPQHNNEKIILNILHDALIFDRFCETIYDTFKIKTGDWCPVEGTYKGADSAYEIMNIDDTLPLHDDLQNVFSKYARSNIDLIPASKSIYLEWQQLIKA